MRSEHAFDVDAFLARRWSLAWRQPVRRCGRFGFSGRGSVDDRFSVDHLSKPDAETRLVHLVPERVSSSDLSYATGS